MGESGRMDYPAHLAQFRRLIGNIAAKRPDMLERPFEIAPEIHTDAARFALEREKIFSSLPLALGHASSLPRPGDILTLDILGQPLLLTHGRDGRIRGFLNVCRHRGTRLIDAPEGARRSSISCPYHSWTYALDGALSLVPEAEGFEGIDLKRRGLTEIPLEVRHGFIWAGIVPGKSLALDDFLCGIGADMDAFGMAAQQGFARRVTRRKTNWKLIVEAFLEGYHIVRLHKNTIGGFFFDNQVVMDCVGPHIRAAVARQEFAEVPDLAEKDWSARRHVSYAYLLFPSTVLVMSPDYTSVLTLFPESADETTFIHTMVTPHAPRDEKERDHWNRSFELIEGGVFQSEDLWVAEEIQRGLRSGANKTLVYGRYELGIKSFHDRLDEKLGLTETARFIP